MKTKIIITIALFILNTLLCIGQERLSLSVLQDAKLGIVGDSKHGYDAGTLDVLIRLNMQGNQQKYGYLVVFPEVEIANLKPNYVRYSANIGYTFNQLFINKLEVSGYGSYGWINREGMSTSSFGVIGEIGYKISDRFKILADLQVLQRKDLDVMYNDANVIKWSGFLGLEIKIF